MFQLCPDSSCGPVEAVATKLMIKNVAIAIHNANYCNTFLPIFSLVPMLCSLITTHVGSYIKILYVLVPRVLVTCDVYFKGSIVKI